MLVEKDHPWASRKPSKRALQLAFYTGALTISERTGMLKTYELMDRHFGWDKPPEAGLGRRRSSTICWIARCASQGIVSLDSVCHLDAQRKPAIRQLIEARVRRGELVPVALEGAGKQEHWARPEALESRRGACRNLSTSSRRSTRSSSSASGCISSSATSIASRPMCRRRSGGSATSPCRS